MSEKKQGRKYATWGDNVVLADFGARRRREMAAGKTEPKFPHRETEGWAASLLMEAVAENADSGRLARGREYYRADKVLGVELLANMISGLVAGTQLEPFDVTVRLRPLGDRQREFVKQELLMDASHMRSLARGSAPGDDVASILLRRDHIGQLSCTCPDKSAVCKHVVCVMYAVSARLTRDPLHILRLRGIDPAPLLQQLGQADHAAGVVPLGRSVEREKQQDSSKAAAADGTPEIVDTKAFWGEGTDDVTWEPFVEEWGMEKGDEQALMGALRTVSFTGVDQLYIRHELERCYETLSDSQLVFDNPPWSEDPLSGVDARNGQHD